MAHSEQIGDYVVTRTDDPEAFWGVKMAGAEEHLSWHNTRRAAKEAITRYQAVDNRRLAALRR